jgi:hypothetical protein
MMKVFNGRSATDEYMSTHSLTFSTPEMTLKKFALWLGDQVPSRGDSNNCPRLLLYLEEVNEDNDEQMMNVNPNVDDSFRPTGAVTEMYGQHIEPNKLDSRQTNSKESTVTNNNLGSHSIGKRVENQIKRYCIHCGSSISASAKFCNKCGNKQD